MHKNPPPKIDLSDEAVVQCPYATYQILHRQGGTGVDPAIGTAVGGYQDLMALARDTATFSSSITQDGQGPRHMGVGSEPVQPDVEAIFENAHPMVNALFTADPPVHTRHRKLLSKALSPGRVRALEPHIRTVARELAEGFRAQGRLDLFRDFAVPLPVTVIADVLGVDRADLWTFKEWGDLMISGNIDVLDHAQRRRVAEAVVAFHRYFIPRIEARRARPTDDLLSEMVNAREADEPPLSTEELLPIIDQVLLAGHETTTNLIGNGVLVLLERPELLARLRENADLIEPFVEEVLRWDPPIQCTYRRATREAELGGAPITPGAMVVPLWAAAGYDPSVFPEPERFDPERPNVRKHMGFGYGPHFCAGAELARLEARIAFDTLLANCDVLALDEAESDLRRLPSFASQGYRRIVLRFSAGGATGGG
ncbi:cytochrome P450 [Pseudohaliea rubra]|nr:cytochrome P450 [Pseudohaliea rubra]